MRGVAPISLESPGTTTAAWLTAAGHMVILGSVSLHHLYLVLGSSHGAFPHCGKNVGIFQTQSPNLSSLPRSC